MRRKEMWMVVSLLVVLGLFMGSSFCWSKEPAKPVVIKWKGQTAYTIPTDIGPFKGNVAGGGNVAMGFKRWIERDTGGRLQIDVNPPGAIVPISEMFNAISKGALDFGGLYYGGFHTGLMPETDIECGLPFAWEIPQEAWDAYYNRGLIDEFRKIYAEHNIYYIPVIIGEHYNFGTKFPCPNSDALKGKKLRALGIYGELVRRLGGSPVVIGGGELYMALKLGTVDGSIFGLEGAESHKYKEVWNYFVESPNLSTVVGSILINMDKFKALPEETRRMIHENAKFQVLQHTMNSWVYELYLANKASKEYPFQLVQWPAEDTAKVRKMGFDLWSLVAAKSPRCAKLVDIVRLQMRELGKMD